MNMPDTDYITRTETFAGRTSRSAYPLWHYLKTDGVKIERPEGTKSYEELERIANDAITNILNKRK